MAEKDTTSDKIFNSDVVWKVGVVIVFGAIMYRDVETLKYDNTQYKQDLANLTSRVSQLDGKFNGQAEQKQICSKVLDMFIQEKQKQNE